ncbi:MAG: hypothetical protein CO031_02080 [Candidatus Nealsonbacteria bacterium CG_4_9_14_0_2_um_filter_37_38]|uniref:HTH cro/C1-type domain-containing protein n=1 Tax=Candidatus Nealsonbacteria bacterium CG_4_10_14_0_8_um_filter_37_14 TaxID=1974684 RepID=A0A2M7R5N0_9BACT|nr:MAG: hypothetical protein COV63_00170 [Candidatus Nealsonbacteria bacterium CG11_big_fil_rev_8_21_14_0_20_37_68]PIY88710.1 MAG: hypothetical protein COY73_03030 [Candidatus Nealsonbacteria bacterium CG_4_10_14_0_8_um_filter_37_14]PJC51540.1 MAG: hypothetical protein CO031_02080 [Candidatus Nealsonbacteria bacterium CG_4_9_14_0_2_um_filter_37_38]
MSRELSTIGENIRYHRKKLGLSQDKLSKLAEVAYNTVVKIESGENPNPTIDTLTKIAKALGVSVDNLLKIHENKISKQCQIYKRN